MQLAGRRPRPGGRASPEPAGPGVGTRNFRLPLPEEFYNELRLAAREASARGPTAVPLKKGAGGLRKGSVVVCHQVTTLDREKLVTRWGALDADELAAVEDGLRAALDL